MNKINIWTLLIINEPDKRATGSNAIKIDNTLGKKKLFTNENINFDKY